MLVAANDASLKDFRPVGLDSRSSGVYRGGATEMEFASE